MLQPVTWSIDFVILLTYRHNMFKSLKKHRVLSNLSSVGLLVGVNLLIACVVVDDMGFLAIPALAVLVPSLLWGMR